MHISEICTRKVVTCRPDTGVLEMAQLMRDKHVGDLIVVETRDGKMVPVGIVTDRDLVIRVVAKAANAEMFTASDVMCVELDTALESEAIYDAIWHMRSRGIRRLPVVDACGALLGMLTKDDVTAFLAKELTDVARVAPRQSKQERANLSPVTS